MRIVDTLLSDHNRNLMRYQDISVPLLYISLIIRQLYPEKIVPSMDDEYHLYFSFCSL